MALDFFQAAAALAQVSQWQAMACPQALQMYASSANQNRQGVEIQLGAAVCEALD